MIEAASQTTPGSGTDRAEKESMQLLLGDAQLLLSEKRTALSVMRTGIGVFALPLGVLSLLIAFSGHYDARGVLHLIVPLLGLCLALVVLGSYLVLRSIFRLRHYDLLLNELKKQHPVIGRYIE